MVFGTTFLILAVLIIAVWLIIEAKRFKHKLFAIFLIGLILFSYFSFISVFKEQQIDFKSISGITSAGKLYFSWLFSVFGNFKTITMNVINMDWKLNETGVK